MLCSDSQSSPVLLGCAGLHWVVNPPFQTCWLQGLLWSLWWREGCQASMHCLSGCCSPCPPRGPKPTIDQITTETYVFVVLNFRTRVAGPSKAPVPWLTHNHLLTCSLAPPPHPPASAWGLLASPHLSLITSFKAHLQIQLHPGTF